MNWITQLSTILNLLPAIIYRIAERVFQKQHQLLAIF